MEVGAGTFAPATFFGVLGPREERVGYVQPSRRPADGRYATDRWQPGEAILDSYVLSPNPQSAGVFIVEVGVRPFRGDWLPVLDDGEARYFAVGEVSYQ